MTATKTVLTDAQLEEIERSALQADDQTTIPTAQLRQLLDEIHDLRNQVFVLEMKMDGSRVIIDALTAAARTDIHTKISEIQIERPNGPPFFLIEALPR